MNKDGNKDVAEKSETPVQKEAADSSQVKNAHAAGDGAMERKDTELSVEESEKKPLESNY